MDEALLMTTWLLMGAGAGALLVYARDRHLLHLYSHLISNLSHMVERQQPSPPEPPASVEQVPVRAPDPSLKRAS